MGWVLNYYYTQSRGLRHGVSADAVTMFNTNALGSPGGGRRELFLGLTVMLGRLLRIAIVSPCRG